MPTAPVAKARNYGKKSYHRSFRLRRVRVSPEQPLLTLASDTALIVDVAPAADGAYRCISISGVHAIVNLAAVDGPVTVGFAHGDYTIAEIKACLEQAGAISVGNKTAQEVANRQVRVVGVISGLHAVLNDGRPIKTRLNWLIPIGKTVSLFAFNESTGVLITGSRQTFTGDMWVKDGS